ncbi:MAG: hypothetical protein IT203_02615 [Fimbriimonadaceae bacterium]|nr:hypothetical protein [Fimbriimonadaceae bacterium]
MSQLTQAATLLDAIKQDCIDAWGLTNATVEFDLVRLPQTATTYAVVDLIGVSQEFQGLRKVVQTYTFRITGRFPFPTSGNILLCKITKANLLISQLVTGPNYAAVAYLPIVTEFDPTENDEPQKKSYEFSITFECKVEEDHH